MTWFRACIEINLVFVSGDMQNCLAFRVGIEIDSTSVLGLKLTCFCVGVEIDLALVLGPKIDLFFLWGSKLTLFLCACRKLLVFSVSIKINLVFVIFEIDLISVWGIESN